MMEIFSGIMIGITFMNIVSCLFLYVKQHTEVKLTVNENGRVTNVYYKSNRLRKGDTYKIYQNDELLSSGEVINHSAEWGEVSKNNA